MSSPDELRQEATKLSVMAAEAERKIKAWREQENACLFKAVEMEQGRGVRKRPGVDTSSHRIEVAVGPNDDDWQLRAVRVGKGIEVTRSERFNGWVSARTMRRWCKQVTKLARQIEAEYAAQDETIANG